MKRLPVLLVILVLFLPLTAAVPARPQPAGPALRVGFGEADITPKLDGDRPVYMAGFGQDRKAKGVHDPLLARAVVLQEGERKIALVSLDLVGFFYGNVTQVRQLLPDYHYVLVSSTHNHEGPDTLGLWGPSAFKSGIDPDYLRLVERQATAAVRAAEKTLQSAAARIGSVKAPELLHDGREPYIKHDDLVVLEFRDAAGGKRLGLLVQWNCHPETLDDKNVLLSADYVGYTVAALQKKLACPVAYFTGTVGGLMTSLRVPVVDDKGVPLKDGTFEKTERYGFQVAAAAERALSQAQPLALTPLEVRRREIFLPMQNKLYQAGRLLGVLVRDSFYWTGDSRRAEPAPVTEKEKLLCIKTEIALVRMGDLEIACIPGEIYPELVLGKVQDPVDPAADFPAAPIEPAIYAQLKAPHRMLIGLANDEIGYLLPKRQWDEKPPYCYGRSKAQYGEVNSIGPEAGPIICREFQALTQGK